MNLQKVLAENMLRFGSKNLDSTAKQKLKRLTEQAGAKDEPAFVALGNALMTGRKKPYAWLSKTTGVLYVPAPESINVVLDSATPVSYIGYGLSATTYKWKTTDPISSYTFPQLTVVGNIVIKASGGVVGAPDASQTGPAVSPATIDTTSATSWNGVVDKVKESEAPTWNRLGEVRPATLVSQFIDMNKAKLQLDVNMLTMQNKITAAVFADKSTTQWAAIVINQLGGQV